ncbi:MAG: ATP-binding cassette domain-containing protein, partial [Planctomycetes bacterium]|nr:ATP-binding cassette domain-containing protein [Planctomycetota bacterium]
MSRPRFPELPRTRTQPRLEMIDVHHAYDLGGQTLVVLDGLGLEIWAGECVALCGPDGSGKNATLNLLSGLETPRSGQVRLDGQDMVSLKPGELHQLHHRIFCHVVPAFILDR